LLDNIADQNVKQREDTSKREIADNDFSSLLFN